MRGLAFSNTLVSIQVHGLLQSLLQACYRTTGPITRLLKMLRMPVFAECDAILARLKGEARASEKQEELLNFHAFDSYPMPR